ncbi:MAG: hypothetical protein IJX55_04120 [Clostridia bacterium]|nr:hypothetical protein [Clostridia bacterium]
MKKISFYIEPFAPAGLFLLFFSWELTARVAVVCSVLVHELAHLAAVKLCGGKTERVRITAFGISLGFSAPKTYGEEAFVAAAGPLASFAFAALGHFCGGAFGGEVLSFSLFLGLINLLPFEGFDGGRIIGASVSSLFGERAGARVCSALSYACLFAAWVIAVYIFFYSGVNFALLLFCAYIFVFTVIKKDCNSENKVI